MQRQEKLLVHVSRETHYFAIFQTYSYKNDGVV